jgi:hypothetical protein
MRFVFNELKGEMVVRIYFFFVIDGILLTITV